MCECLPDYVGDGRQCVHSLGKCGEINGGCSTRAQCKLFYPGKHLTKLSRFDPCQNFL